MLMQKCLVVCHCPFTLPLSPRGRGRGKGHALFMGKAIIRSKRRWSQTPYHFREFGNSVDIFLSLSRRNPHQAQTVLQPHEPYESLKKGDPLDGHVITIQVMAIADVSPSHQDPVRSALKRSQEVMRRYGGGTHDPYGPEVGGVLKPAHPCQIRCTVSTPVAEKGQDSGFKRSHVYGSPFLTRHHRLKALLIWA